MPGLVPAQPKGRSHRLQRSGDTTLFVFFFFFKISLELVRIQFILEVLLLYEWVDKYLIYLHFFFCFLQCIDICWVQNLKLQTHINDGRSSRLIWVAVQLSV